MSRVAKTHIIVPVDVNVIINGQIVSIFDKNNKLTKIIHNAVEVKYKNGYITFSIRKGFNNAWMQAGTARSLLNSMIFGIKKGFTKKLQTIGVGYRVTIENNIINLFLGFSHSIKYILPSGITAECPTQTEIILKGIDKQIVGQVAAKLRNYRPPEPYKGKGIRYINEIIRTKEIKNKKK
ncbi:50S ribosomal protein L6 [Candidatus Providencia siddallii]|uniref:50S ribosomal protein L6 n=1 Tax=Candidatus Providencia siddallii TaxID=1715285 RepID=A0ABM9NNS3_9GAMM